MKHLIRLIRRSLRKSKLISIWLFVISMLSVIFLYACSLPLPVNVTAKAPPAPASTLVSQAQAFTSNGERIYLTSTSDRGTNITTTGGSSWGSMMGNGTQGGMTGNRGMMGNGTQGSMTGNGGIMGNGTQGSMTGNGTQGSMMGNGTQGSMGNGVLTCASCHLSDGRGGEQIIVGMQTINAPDIRWSALKHEFNDEKFRLAITQGQDPDGKKMLNRNMPRWQIGDEDLADLIGYLKTL